MCWELQEARLESGLSYSISQLFETVQFCGSEALFILKSLVASASCQILPGFIVDSR